MKGKRPCVIVIDDDVAVLEEVTSAVPGWQVEWAWNGAEGMAAIRRHESQLDGVILDHLMPHSGTTVCAQIRTDYPNLPILPYIVDRSMETQRFFQRMGCIPLLKPATPALLSERLHQLIGQPAAAADPSAIISVLIQLAQTHEQMVLQRERLRPRVAIYVSAGLLLEGFSKLMTAAGALVCFATASAGELQRRLPWQQVMAMVADANGYAVASEAAHACGLPLIVIGLTATAGYRLLHSAQAVLVEPVTADCMAEALLAVQWGETYYDRRLIALAPDRLTKTEQRILIEFLRDIPLPTIAETLDIRPETVKKHLSNIFVKFEVNTLDGLRAAINKHVR